MSAAENIVDDFERKMTAQEKSIGILQQIWDRLLPTVEQPAKAQFAVWAAFNGLPDLPLLNYAIQQAADKNLKMAGTMTPTHAVRFVSSVLSFHRRQRRQAGLRKCA
jgi:hypothetical protein